MLSNAEYMKQAAEAGLFLGTETLPSETLKMATAIVVTGPILLVYPFVIQKSSPQWRAFHIVPCHYTAQLRRLVTSFT